MNQKIKKIGSNIGNFFIEYKILAILILLCVILSFTSPIFLTKKNLINILRQVSITAIVASGFTLTLTSGSIDLSIGAVLSVSALICANMMKAGIPTIICILTALCIGAIMGAITGLITNSFKLDPFIATLATMQVYRGIAWLYSGGVQIFEFDEKFLQLGTGYWGIIPIPVIIMLIVAIITAIILNKTRFGRNVCAVGGNRVAARVSGINIKKTSVMAYAYTGMLAALAGIVTTARLNMARPDAGNGIEMDVIAAVVIGGTSLSGGKGTVLGTIIGCLLVGTINNGLTINGVNPYITMICKGLLILVAVILDNKVGAIFSKRKKEKKANA